MKMQKHWYLGFLGIIGFYFIPDAIHALGPEGHWLEARGLLWFGWFLCFWPEEENVKEKENNNNVQYSSIDETIDNLLTDDD